MATAKMFRGVAVETGEIGERPKNLKERLGLAELKDLGE